MEVVGDGDARITYQGNWSVQNATGADQGSVHSSTDPAGIVSLKFVGSSIQFDAVKSSRGANFTVLLDGSTYGPYSLYSPTTTVGNVWNQSQLNPTATHTISVQKARTSAGPDSVSVLNVDAFRIAAASPSSSPSSTTASSTQISSSTSMSTSTSSLRQEPTSTHSSSPIMPSRPPSSSPVPSSSNLLSPSTSHNPNSQPTYSSPFPDTQPAPSPDAYTTILADDPIPQPAIPGTTTYRSSTSSLSQNSTTSSQTSPRSSTTLVAFSFPRSAETSATAAAVDSAPSTSGQENRTGIILGTIVGIIIFVCLITIPIIYIKRKREENLANEFKASTTPAYQTRTAKGLPMPLGIYKRSVSATSPTSPINHHWGFGSQTNHRNQSVSPSATLPSPRARGRPTSFEDTEGRSHYYLYPDAAPEPAPVEFRPLERTDSIASDYPYPLSYYTPR